MVSVFRPPGGGGWRLKVKIREQLSILVALTAVTAVGVLSLIFWVNNRRLIQSVTSSRLSMTVSMKSAQMGQAFSILHQVALGISTRTIVRNSLRRYQKSGNNTAANWEKVEEDLRNAASASVGGFHEILQIALFDIELRNGTQWPNVENGTLVDGVVVGNLTYDGYVGNGTRVNIGPGLGGPVGLLNVTGDNARGIFLPGLHGGPMLTPLQNATDDGGVGARFWEEANYNYSVGLRVSDGFPRELYPLPDSAAQFPRHGMKGNTSAIFTSGYIEEYEGLLLGPMLVNQTMAILSLTFPVYDGDDDLLGYSTIVLNASSLLDIMNDTRGMGRTGQTVLIGPAWVNALWNDTRISSNKLSRELAGEPKPDYADEKNTSLKTQIADYKFIYLLPPKNTPELAGQILNLSDYPAVQQLYAEHITDGASALDAENAQGKHVGVSYALPGIHRNLADWGLLIEQSKSEAFEPVSKLEKLLLATVFGTFAVVMAIVWPIAHLSVRPIVRLKAATKTTRGEGSEDSSEAGDNMEKGRRVSMYSIRKRVARLRSGTPDDDGDDMELRDSADTGESGESTGQRRGFRIPRKVPDRKHFIHDELTDLTATFNEMTDELSLQYSTLESRVNLRTRELNHQRLVAEEQRSLAESANEAKSMFIANISHELRTPLNAIINMCDVAMEQIQASAYEDVKQSLEIAAVAGKSLLHLITDLLTFTRNGTGTGGGRVGREKEEEEFGIGEVERQVLAVFGRVAEERGVGFKVKVEGGVRDMRLRADVKRVVQCLLNLVGNGLKFTPRSGLVTLNISLLTTPPCTHSTPISVRASPCPSPPPALSRQSTNSTILLGPADDAISPDSYTLTQALNSALTSPPHQPPSEKQADVQYRLQFIISDNGPGIPSHLQKKVFEPFVQAEMRLSKQHDGVGLGLSICRQIVKMLGGKIRLESPWDEGGWSEKADASGVGGGLGGGTRFTIDVPVTYLGPRPPTPPEPAQLPPLPASPITPTFDKNNKPHLSSLPPNNPLSVHPPTTATTITATTMPAPGNPTSQPSTPFNSIPSTPLSTSSTPAPAPPLKILIAEDNPTNRTVILQMLRLQSQTNITLAFDGAQALALLTASLQSNSPYSIVLMDIQMPNMDGIECTRLVREMGYTAPIVALTAYADEANRGRCLGVGMDDFLEKPVRKERLREVLGRVGGRELGGVVKSGAGSTTSTVPGTPAVTPGWNGSSRELKLPLLPPTPTAELGLRERELRLPATPEELMAGAEIKELPTPPV